MATSTAGLHAALMLIYDYESTLYSVSGSKLCMSPMSHVARIFDVLSMVLFGTRMYCRKQSLDHLPMACINHLGQPRAAAVEAAPMRRECDEIFILPSVDWTRS